MLLIQLKASIVLNKQHYNSWMLFIYPGNSPLWGLFPDIAVLFL